MKTILSTLLVAIAASVQAATINWNWKSDAVVKFDTTSIGGNGTAYLIYLGAKEVTDYTFAQFVDMTASAEANAPTKVGKVNTSGVATDTTHTGNFATVLSYKSGDDTYYNVSSSMYTITSAQVTSLLNEGTPLPDSSFSFSNSVTTEKGKGTVGGGWAMVPEPSTAMLALAGLALLIKRRRA